MLLIMNKNEKIKISYKRFLLSVVMIFGLLIPSCTDLGVENTNDADRERALKSSADLIKLLEGATSSVFRLTVARWGVHMSLMADQITATNRSLSFWDLNMEPRIAIPNSTTWDDIGAVISGWTTFYNNIASGQQCAFYN